MLGILPTFLAVLVTAQGGQGFPPGQAPGGQFPGGTPGGRQGRQGRPTTPAEGETATPAAPMIEVPTSVTNHTITLPSGPVTYTAIASQIPLRSDTGEIECRMFSVSYLKDGENPHTRPVTFAFNGGPGSATMWLHMGALGPKRAPMNDDGTLPAPPYQALDNMDTWLDFSDVVVRSAGDRWQERHFVTVFQQSGGRR